MDHQLRNNAMMETSTNTAFFVTESCNKDVRKKLLQVIRDKITVIIMN